MKRHHINKLVFETLKFADEVKKKIKYFKKFLLKDINSYNDWNAKLLSIADVFTQMGKAFSQ